MHKKEPKGSFFITSVRGVECNVDCFFSKYTVGFAYILVIATLN